MSATGLRCPTGTTLILGGARSGKSDLAVQLGVAWGGPVTFVATCEPGDDDSLASRIARHRADRPSSWRTVEDAIAVPETVHRSPIGSLVIVDCVSLWIARLLMDGLTEDDATQRASALSRACAVRDAPVLLVSNEVGLGVHPSTPLGSEFRDVLGRANRCLADAANRSVLLIAGRVLRLTPVEEVFS